MLKTRLIITILILISVNLYAVTENQKSLIQLIPEITEGMSLKGLSGEIISNQNPVPALAKVLDGEIEVPVSDPRFEVSFNSGETKNFKMQSASLQECHISAIVLSGDDVESAFELEMKDVRFDGIYIVGGKTYYFYTTFFSLTAKSGAETREYHFTIANYILNSSEQTVGGRKYKNCYFTIGGNSAPVANFIGSPTSGNAPLLVRFTNNSTGEISGRSWDFGDGQTSTSTNPSHTYQNAGTYTVKLTASGPGGSNTKTRTNYITVSEGNVITISEARKDNNLDFIPDLLNQNVKIKGIVISPNFGSKTEYCIQDETAGIYLYSNDFTRNLQIGDEISVSGTIAQYNGKTEIIPNDNSLIITLSQGNQVPTPMPVNIDEIGEETESILVKLINVWLVDPSEWPSEGNWANVRVTDGTDTTNLYVDKDTNLDGWTPPSGNLDIVGIGDQYTSSDPPNDGYNVRLRFRDDITNTILSSPVANFYGTPTSGTAPLTVQFTDQSTGNITSRSWDFGDGQTSTSTNPSHTYQNTGTYTVKLTVLGPGGSNTKFRNNYIEVFTTGTNLIKNSEFDQGMSYWYTFLKHDSKYTMSIDNNSVLSGRNSLKYVIEEGGTKDWYITVFTHIPLQKDKYYEVRFKAKLEGGKFKRIRIPFQHEGEPWTVYCDKTVTLSDTTENYGPFLLKPNVDDPKGRFNFALGLTDNIVIYLDAVLVAEYIPGPPVTEFSATPLSGEAPLSVKFNDESTGLIKSREWDFGDGKTSRAMNPRHTYQDPGIYDVSLTLIGVSGDTVNLKKENYITIVSTNVENGKTNNKLLNSFSLEQNYPNPFNPETKIYFYVPIASHVILDIYNSNGEKVLEIFKGRVQEGHHSLIWNASNFPTGTYFIRMKTNRIILTKKCILIK